MGREEKSCGQLTVCSLIPSPTGWLVRVGEDGGSTPRQQGSEMGEPGSPLFQQMPYQLRFSTLEGH